MHAGAIFRRGLCRYRGVLLLTRRGVLSAWRWCSFISAQSAVLIVFTILLTRRDVDEDEDSIGAGLSSLRCVWRLAWSVLKTQSLAIHCAAHGSTYGQRIGEALMTTYVWPLQCVGLLLTAALIGALISLRRRNNEGERSYKEGYIGAATNLVYGCNSFNFLTACL